MDKLELQSNTIMECINLAKKLMFGLCAFSIVAVYIEMFSAYNLQQEISVLRTERTALNELKLKGNSVLGEIREFYEGPAEANWLNFSSFIYALEITRHHLQQTLEKTRTDEITRDDRKFLLFQSQLIESNSFELHAIMKGLIDQKQRRVSFERLSLPDLLDLDYHKGKGAWDLYYKWSSLRYALYTPDSYGYRKLPNELDSLEKRYGYFLDQSEETRNSSTQPKGKGRDEKLAIYLDKLSSSGFENFGALSKKIVQLDIEIKKKDKESENVLKLPFIDQKVDFESLVWLVPLTILSVLLFVYFYLLKTKQILSDMDSNSEESLYVPKFHSWAALAQDKQDYLLFCTAFILRISIFGLPLLVSMYIVIRTDFFGSTMATIGLFLTSLSFVAVGLCVRELLSIKNFSIVAAKPNKSIQQSADAATD